MKKHHFLSLLYGLFATILLAACSPAQPEATEVVSHGGEVTDYISLVDALRAEGATVEPTGSIDQPFFSVQGQTITVNGEGVQVFEFESEAAAESAVDLVSPDGSSVGANMITWIDTPHFYHKGKLIVLYVGSNDSVTANLEHTLGAQIAGG